MFLQLFRTKYYLPFIPKKSIKNFKVPAWKCLTLNAGEVTDKPLMFQRLTDGKSLFVSFNDLGRKLWSQPEYIKWLYKMGYQAEVEDDQLVFTPITSNT